MSKGRGERGGKPPSANQPPPSNVQNAIIPGKLLESDWNAIVQGEEDDEFVYDLIQEIVDSTCDLIFNNIIESRLIPFSVLSAKNLMLDIINWRFIQSDKMELSTNDHLSWIEDDEPTGCVTDSWAHGAVPVVQNPVSKPVNIANDMGEGNTNAFKEMPAGCDEVIEEISNEEIKLTDEDIIKVEDSKTQEVVTPINEKIENINQEKKDKIKKEILEKNPSLTDQHFQINKKKEKKLSPPDRRNSKRHGGSLPRYKPITFTPIMDDLSQLPTPIEKSKSPKHGFLSSDSFAMNQHGRSLPKEVTYDEKGNIIHVKKINVAKLPSHRIKTKYEIVDPENEAVNKAHLLTRKNKNLKNQKLLKLQENYIKQNLLPSAPLLQQLFDANDVKIEKDVHDSSYTPLPPSLIDTIEISNGVIVREGGLSRQGPNKKNVPDAASNIDLLPLGSARTQVIDVKDILNQNSSTVNTFNDKRRLPSIKS